MNTDRARFILSQDVDRRARCAEALERLQEALTALGEFYEAGDPGAALILGALNEICALLKELVP